MSTNSDQYRTYAEYARKSLLRLRIVKGLSDDLITEIVLRGITDPQVKATATNANLKPVDLVNYLSTFVKPIKTTAVDTSKRTNHHFTANRDKNNSQGFKKVLTKCSSCGESGHRQISCPKRHKSSANTDSGSKPTSSESRPVSSEITCAYCKKPGHDIKSCFAKRRVDEQGNNKKVNFCSAPLQKHSDIVVGVIQGIPVDILIDSGAIGVSLISSLIVTYFSCAKKTVNCQIKGVGESVTQIDSYVTLTIELEGISLQVDLLVVPSECMNAPVIIGTDVLNRDGVVYIRTKNTQRIIRDSNPLAVSTAALNVQPVIDTLLSGDHLSKLKAILEDYSEHMISGTATSTVNTGCMRIQLSSDDAKCQAGAPISWVSRVFS